MKCEWPDWSGQVEVVTDKAYFVTRDDESVLLAKFCAPIEIIELVSLGRIKDARLPDYYLCVRSPAGQERGRSEVAILEAPWEGGAMWQGIVEVCTSVVSRDLVEVKASGSLPLRLGRASGEAKFNICGRFRKDVRGWGKVQTHFDIERNRLLRLK